MPGMVLALGIQLQTKQMPITTIMEVLFQREGRDSPEHILQIIQAHGVSEYGECDRRRVRYGKGGKWVAVLTRMTRAALMEIAFKSRRLGKLWYRQASEGHTRQNKAIRFFFYRSLFCIWSFVLNLQGLQANLFHSLASPQIKLPQGILTGKNYFNYTIHSAQNKLSCHPILPWGFWSVPLPSPWATERGRLQGSWE